MENFIKVMQNLFSVLTKKNLQHCTILINNNNYLLQLIKGFGAIIQPEVHF